MKNFKLLSLAAMAALVLLTSCLGESSNTGTLTSPGKVRLDSSGRTLVDTSFGSVYAKEITNWGYGNGDCMLINFTYDLSSAENADIEKNGFVYVTLNTTPYTIDRGSVNMHKGDTTALMTNEIALEKGVYSFQTPYFAYLNGTMFLTSSFTGLTDQKTSWMLFYDPSQEPSVENGKNVYTLFLRATLREEGKTPSVSQAEMNAFDLEYIIDQINQKEKAAGNSDYYMKFDFVKSIEKDETFKWESSSLLAVPVPEESK